MLLFGAIGLAAVFTLETVTAVFTLAPERDRRDLRLGEDARDGRSQSEGGRRAGLVQAVHLRHDARRAAAGGGVHRRARQPRRGAPPDRSARPQRRAAPRPRRRGRTRPGRDAPVPAAARLQDPARRGGVRRERRARRHRQGAQAAGRHRPRRRSVAHAPPLAAPRAGRRGGDLRRPREHLGGDDRARHPPRHPHRAARRRRQRRQRDALAARARDRPRRPSPGRDAAGRADPRPAAPRASSASATMLTCASPTGGWSRPSSRPWRE